MFNVIFRPPNNLLLCGFLFLALAVGGTLTGVVPTRAGPAYRDKDPKSFWFCTAIYLLGGIFLTASYFDRVRIAHN